MASSLSIYNPSLFPPGTQVGAYLRKNWPSHPTLSPTGKPPIAASASGEIPPGGELILESEALHWEHRYWIAGEVAGEWRYDEAATAPFSYWLPNENKEDSIEHAKATKGVHGVADFAALLKAPESPGTYTQTFSTAARTHAEAELATNLPTNLNVVTTLLGTLVGEVNATNKRVNDIAKALNEAKKLVNSLIDDAQATGIAK